MGQVFGDDPYGPGARKWQIFAVGSPGPRSAHLTDNEAAALCAGDLGAINFLAPNDPVRLAQYQAGAVATCQLFMTAGGIPGAVYEGSPPPVSWGWWLLAALLGGGAYYYWRR